MHVVLVYARQVSGAKQLSLRQLSDSHEFPIMAGSTQWGALQFAAIEKSAVFGERRLTGASVYSPSRPQAAS